MKKRLPVLKNTPEEEQGEAPRPPWHWVGFGTVVIFGALLPLVVVAQKVQAKLLADRFGSVDSPEQAQIIVQSLSRGEYMRYVASAMGPSLVAVALAGMAGGYVVGRWGGDNAGIREAAIAGVTSTLVITALSWGRVPLAGVLIVLLLLVAMAALGAKVGLRKRIKSLTPNMP